MNAKIEGIPDGWEPVRFDYANDGEYFLGGDGEPLVHPGIQSQVKRLIVRKIEKLKRCRAFANAAEFEPNKDRWILNATIDDPGAVGMSKITAFDDEGVTLRGSFYFTYEDLFELDIRFDNNQPFGIEVTEGGCDE